MPSLDLAALETLAVALALLTAGLAVRLLRWRVSTAAPDLGALPPPPHSHYCADCDEEWSHGEAGCLEFWACRCAACRAPRLPALQSAGADST